MFLINPTLNTNHLDSDGMNHLLYEIDGAIADLAFRQFIADTTGKKLNVDFNIYDILCEYREILIDYLIGCNCLEDEFLILIVSKIQKRLDTNFTIMKN